MHIRLRSKRGGDHVNQRIFVGEDRDHLALAGEITLRVGEWQEFGAALYLGAKETGGRVTFDSPDAEQVIKDGTVNG